MILMLSHSNRVSNCWCSFQNLLTQLTTVSNVKSSMCQKQGVQPEMETIPLIIQTSFSIISINNSKLLQWVGPEILCICGKHTTFVINKPSKTAKVKLPLCLSTTL